MRRCVRLSGHLQLLRLGRNSQMARTILRQPQPRKVPQPFARKNNTATVRSSVAINPNDVRSWDAAQYPARLLRSTSTSPVSLLSAYGVPGRSSRLDYRPLSAPAIKPECGCGCVFLYKSEKRPGARDNRTHAYLAG